MNTKKVKDNIKRIAKSKGILMKDVTGIMGVLDNNFYRSLKSGALPIRKIYEIADFLECYPHELLNIDENSTNVVMEEQESYVKKASELSLLKSKEETISILKGQIDFLQEQLRRKDK